MHLVLLESLINIKNLKFLNYKRNSMKFKDIVKLRNLLIQHLQDIKADDVAWPLLAKEQRELIDAIQPVLTDLNSQIEVLTINEIANSNETS